MGRESSTRAVLFADVSKSGALYQKLGDTAARNIIDACLGSIADVLPRFEGRLVKTLGDAIFCTFATADLAVLAASEMQAIVTSTRPGDYPIGIHIGLAYGPVLLEDDDVFGDTVNVAARVVAHAKPGQILVAKQTVRKLPRDVASSMRFVGSTQVKGKKDMVDLYELIWERENLTLVQDVAAIEARPENVRLTATFGSLTMEVGSALPVLHLGRGPENEFVIPDPLASRVHARIEFRRDRFLLIDQSLNGTYVQMQGAAETVLRRDEIVLDSSGLISLGKSTSAQQQLCVRFRVQRGGPVADRALLRKKSVPR